MGEPGREQAVNDGSVIPVPEKRDRELFLVVDTTVPAGEFQSTFPELSDVADDFYYKLRGSSSVWRSLGFDRDQISAYADNDRLWVIFHLIDRMSSVVIGSVRVEVSDAEWKGAWVSPSVADAPALADAEPAHEVGGRISDPEDSEAELGEAIEWLRRQLSSPVVHYVWRRDGDVVAECWRLETTGEDLVVSGPRELRGDPATADERIQVRP